VLGSLVHPRHRVMMLLLLLWMMMMGMAMAMEGYLRVMYHLYHRLGDDCFSCCWLLLLMMTEEAKVSETYNAA